MKRFHLLLTFLILSLGAVAQTKLSVPQAGSISIQNPGGDALATTYPVDKLYYSLAANNVKIFVMGSGSSSGFIIANNNPTQYFLNGTAGSDTLSVKLFLMAAGVGKAPLSGGAGSIGNVKLADILAIEGRELENQGNQAPYNDKRAYVGSNISGALVTPAGKLTWVEAISVDAYTDAPNGMIDIQLLVNKPLDGIQTSLPVIAAHQRMFSKSSRDILIRGFVSERHNIECYAFPELDAADATKKMWLNIAPVGARVITNDLNFNAKYTYWAWGTSITDGSIGCTRSEDIFTFKIRDYYRGKGQDVRLNSSGGWKGATAGDILTELKRNYFGCVTTPDLITLEIGANEAISGPWDAAAQAAFVSNVQQLIALKKTNYPNTKMIALGSFPNANTTTEARLVQIRGMVGAAVTAAADPLITYINLGTAFTATDATNYADGTHPNGQGNQNAFINCIKPALDATLKSL